MNVIVTGAAGQLGVDVTQRLRALGHTPAAADLEQMDITRQDEVLSFFCRAKPQAVIHCAACTSVDRAQTAPRDCREVNILGTANVAAAAERCGAKLLYVSTDYVYAGKGDAPQTEQSPVAPQSVYGRSKYAGELIARLCSRLFVVRTSWVFGTHGSNFVKTMLRLADEDRTISVVADQFGSPTFTEDLAALLCAMIETEKYGIYNASNEGFCSWYEFAAEIFRLAGCDAALMPVSTEAYGAPAPRPKNSRMSKDKLEEAGFDRLPPWQDALRRCLSELNEIPRA